jgi:2-phospho-L-lactate transferase/gluconeogenesis factor (CofD/UPF0052 family)
MFSGPAICTRRHSDLLVDGISEAVAASKAKVYVVSLMTKFGQTYGFTAAEHLRVIQQHVENSVDAVIVNTALLKTSAHHLRNIMSFGYR